MNKYDLFLTGDHMITIESEQNIDEVMADIFLRPNLGDTENIIKMVSFGWEVRIRPQAILAIMQVLE